MTRKNMSLKTEPFLLRPAGKDYLWGGTRLKDDFSKDLPMNPLAETWECSTHPDGPSIIASGKYKGQFLADVIKKHPEYLGTHPKGKAGLPILVKLIDARKDLSVQVHPNDEYAMKYENGSLGKTEMWYVVDAAKDASLIYGFHHDMDRAVLKKSLEEGSVQKYLQKIRIHKDDVFFIEAGTVHAIGKGALIAEIQESSNLTYRLFDYNRVDRKGRRRELHIRKALDVINLKGSQEPRQPMRVLRYRKGTASELLCRCKYFQTERMLVNTECYREMADYQTGENSFQVLLCIGGCGTLTGRESIHFIKGDCIFIPANSIPLKIHGKAEFLKIEC